MTGEELQDLAAELPIGTEVVVEIAATGSELSGPFAGVAGDHLMVDASPGIAGVPADQVESILVEDTTHPPE